MSVALEATSPAPSASPDGRTIGFGIVGCGGIAQVHARAIAAVPGARLVGAASRDPDRARAFCARFAGEFAAGSAEELAAHPGIDVVCVATPSGAHLEVVEAAARAGRHVLVEKPLEVSTARIDRMIACCAERRVRLGAVFQARFGAGAMAVKQALAAGRLGRITLASAQVKWWRDPDYFSASSWRGTRQLDGGGALMNQGIHAVDLLQWFVGMPARVAAVWGTLVQRDLEVEDTIAVLLEWAQGTKGVIEASTAAWPGTARRIEIAGERGTIVLEDDRIVRWDLRYPGPGDADLVARAARQGLPPTGHAAPSGEHAGHARQIESFVQALQRGDPVPLDGSAARPAVALIEAIYTAAETGGYVELAPAVPDSTVSPVPGA